MNYNVRFSLISFGVFLWPSLYALPIKFNVNVPIRQRLLQIRHYFCRDRLFMNFVIN